MAKKSGPKTSRPRRARLLHATVEPSLRTVAAERRRLQRHVRRIREERYDEYRRQAKATARAEPPPLRVLVEGDSWFDYPVPGGGGGVIVQLKEHYIRNLVVANMASAGEEVRQMLALSQRLELEKRLSETNPDLKFDALLFSGGGNDIVGEQFCLWLQDGRPDVPPESLVDGPRLAAALGMIKAAYEDLFHIRDRLSPNTKIFLNGYDFPKVTGIPLCGYGPWLKPSLDYRKVTDPAVQYAVVRTVLMRFAETLDRLAGDYRDVFLVPTQGKLNPDTHWANEIHPTERGFRVIARVFCQALHDQFRDRVPAPEVVRERQRVTAAAR